MKKCNKCSAIVSRELKFCPTCRYPVGVPFVEATPPSAAVSAFVGAIIAGVLVTIVGVPLILVSMCSTKLPSNDASQSGGVPFEIQAAVAVGQTRLESSLKDAPSARFQDRFVSRAGKRLVYCGEVNARNSFGGYNGFRRFIVGPNDPVIVDGEAPAFDLAWSAECSDPAFKLDQ